jgi:hypothetical protein
VKAGSSARVDPLAPCRALTDLICHPDLNDTLYCPGAREKLRIAHSAPPEQQQWEGELCQVRLSREAKGLKEQIDRINGRPTAHLGTISDATLDAKYPGCAYMRRRTCISVGEDSPACKAIVNYIDSSATGTRAEQLDLRERCAGNYQEQSQREAIAKRHAVRPDGGAP